MTIHFEMLPPYPLWTVYERFEPLQYVARLSVIYDEGVRDGNRIIVSSDLPTMRHELGLRGLSPIPAHPKDDPQIVELWL